MVKLLNLLLLLFVRCGLSQLLRCSFILLFLLLLREKHESFGRKEVPGDRNRAGRRCVAEKGACP